MGLGHRALGIIDGDVIVWFWIDRFFGEVTTIAALTAIWAKRA